jgi:glutamate-1-semialdehyde 2,1-aminomutase
VFGDATAGIYGHSHPVIHKAISSALSLGLNLGAHNLMEAKFAGAVCSRFNLDHVRFCNSGTEGNLMAIQTARIVTGRKKVFVFEGCYHGATFIFRNGPHPISIPYEYVMGTYNDVEGTRKLLREHAQDIACVTLEAMLGGGGCVPATKEFVQMLREETEKLGVCLIFDEVMTNRLSPSGIAGVFGIKPDMIALGKSVGGGLSFGGWGGSKKYLGRYDTRLPVEQQIPHAGTFNNASLQMTTGYAGLTEAYTPEACQKLNAYGDQLRAKLNAVAVKHGAPLLFTGIGSMIGTHFTDKKEVKTLAGGFSIVSLVSMILW